jgi:vacuolar protein sorting-associated protein 13A/C
VSKFSNNLSKGLLVLTDDADYINQREYEHIQKPRNVINGLGDGLKGAFTAVASGVVGIYQKPRDGARKGKLRGFLKGGYYGLVGVVIKPISGSLDLIVKTSEGL